MKRRILSIITALVLCLGLCPAGARAAEEPENRAMRTPRTEGLTLTNQDAENEAEGWSWKQTDEDGYCYKLTLDNVNFNVSDYSAITFSMDKGIWLDTIAIELIGENQVISTNQSENTYDGCGILLDTSSSRPPLKIVVSGSGSLTVEGWQCGISLGTDELHFNGVTVNAQAVFPSGLSVTNGGSLLIESSEVSANTIRATGLTARDSDISVICRP